MTGHRSHHALRQLRGAASALSQAIASLPEGERAEALRKEHGRIVESLAALARVLEAKEAA